MIFRTEMFALKELNAFNLLKGFSRPETIALFVLLFVLYQFYLQKVKLKLPPGPKGLPFVGYLPFVGSEMHKTFNEMRKKYGDIIGLRLGMKYLVVINDYKLMKEILNNQDALDRPPEIFDPIPTVGFNILNGEKWHTQRKFSMFAMRNLGLGRNGWDASVKENVNNFIDELASHSGKPFEISRSVALSIMSSITTLLFGRKIEKDSEEAPPLVDFLDVVFNVLSPFNTTTVFPSIRKLQELLKKPGCGKTLTVINKATTFIRDEIAKHKTPTNFKNDEDFIDMYLRAWKQNELQGKKHYFSDFNLQGNITIFFAAAIDTSTISTVWLFRLMAAHPDIQKKVQDEIDEIIGTDGSISYEERTKLPYTMATIMETQRFASIVPLSTSRRITKNIELKDYIIPKGSEVISNIWAIHNDPNNWNEPEKFKPERFLTENNTCMKNPPNFVPFSVGKRNCPGETVAYMTILAFFTHVMQKFWITMPPGLKPDFDIVGGLVTHLKPQPLCFIDRH